MTKRPLGRGLSALISTDAPQAEADEIREIEIDLIRPGHQQPRTTFAQEKLDELANKYDPNNKTIVALLELEHIQTWNAAIEAAEQKLDKDYKYPTEACALIRSLKI